ncbi:hypothetical protein OROMI_003887 [Orobanche minor]
MSFDEMKDALAKSLSKLELLKQSLIVHQYKLKEEFDLKVKLLDDVKDYRCRGYPVPTMILKDAMEREQKLVEGAIEMMPLLDDVIKEQKDLKELIDLGLIRCN